MFPGWPPLARELFHQIDPAFVSGDQDVDLAASPHPLPNIGNGSHGFNLVRLPSCRVLSNHAGLFERGERR
jgi:hypothetical protein